MDLLDLRQSLAEAPEAVVLRFPETGTLAVGTTTVRDAEVIRVGAEVVKISASGLSVCSNPTQGTATDAISDRNGKDVGPGPVGGGGERNRARVPRGHG